MHPHKYVPQASLREYAALRELQRITEQRQQELRSYLLAMISAGLPIEHGPLTGRVKTYTTLVLSRARITAVIGPQAFARLVPRLQQEIQQLLVRPSPRYGLRNDLSADDDEFGPDTMTDLPA